MFKNVTLSLLISLFAINGFANSFEAQIVSTTNSQLNQSKPVTVNGESVTLQVTNAATDITAAATVKLTAHVERVGLDLSEVYVDIILNNKNSMSMAYYIKDGVTENRTIQIDGDLYVGVNTKP